MVRHRALPFDPYLNGKRPTFLDTFCSMPSSLISDHMLNMNSPTSCTKELLIMIVFCMIYFFMYLIINKIFFC